MKPISFPKQATFTARGIKAIRSRSPKMAMSLASDIAKHHFARFLVVDSYGTKKLCWTLKAAYAWVAYGAPELVRIIDTRDFSVVAERRQECVYS